MDLRRLRYFVALADRLNFTATAKFLGIRQPPLSIQIRNLEQEVGGALFLREGRKVALTPLGHRLLEESRPLLSQVDAVTTRMSDAAAGRTGEIRMAFTPSAWSERIARRVRKFLRKNRGVRLAVLRVPEGADALSSRADVDVLIHTLLSPSEEAPILDTARMEIALPPKHRLADRSTVSMSDLVGETVLLSPTAFRSPCEEFVSQSIDHQCLNVSLTPAPSDFAERLWLVSLGTGLAVCSSADQLTFDAVRLPLVEGPELVVTARSNPASRAVALPALLEAIGKSQSGARARP